MRILDVLFTSCVCVLLSVDYFYWLCLHFVDLFKSLFVNVLAQKINLFLFGINLFPLADEKIRLSSLFFFLFLTLQPKFLFNIS